MMKMTSAVAFTPNPNWNALGADTQGPCCTAVKCTGANAAKMKEPAMIPMIMARDRM
jgi:hypothetical protein